MNEEADKLLLLELGEELRILRAEIKEQGEALGVATNKLKALNEYADRRLAEIKQEMERIRKEHNLQ